jgi:metal-dependent amidase/aminoacylase/carboxypeptidase family protein
MEAIELTHGKIDRALRAGGDAVGAKTIIKTSHGQLPLACPEEMNDLFIQNAQMVNPGVKIARIEHFSGSTDMGDVSHIMPAIHPFVGGVTGALHGRDFEVTDFAAACLLPAKAMALSVVDLLYGGAERAKKIIAENRPILTADEYVSKMDKYFKEET